MSANIDFPRQGRGPAGRGSGRLAAPGRDQCYINSRRLMPPVPPPAARKGGRPFRIDTIGRLRASCHGVYRLAWRRPACHHAGFFVARSDTHESVDTRKSSHRTKAGQSQTSTFVCIKEENPNGSKRNDPHPAEGL